MSRRKRRTTPRTSQESQAITRNRGIRVRLSWACAIFALAALASFGALLYFRGIDPPNITLCRMLGIFGFAFFVGCELCLAIIVLLWYWQRKQPRPDS